MGKYSVGSIVEGEVVGVKTYGAFVKIADDITGLLHISEIDNKYIEDINDYFKVGDIIKVKILELDQGGKQVKLSSKKSKHTRVNLADEYFNEQVEFQAIKEKLPRLITDAKERLGLDD